MSGMVAPRLPGRQVLNIVDMPVVSGGELGVIRINGQPWETTVKEIETLVGGWLDLAIAEFTYAIKRVHIMADVYTTKSLDAFVEFESPEKAMLVVDHLNRRINSQPPRHPHLGQRRVKITQSSQAELMSALYPRSKCDWIGTEPILKNPNPEFPTTFNGFITGEELAALVRWADRPNRVSTTLLHHQKVK